jgi:hypothetical protein
VPTVASITTRRGKTRVVCVLSAFAVCIALTLTANSTAQNTAGPQSANNCVVCHKKNGEDVRLYEPSIHASAGISCGRCHGGNASAVEKEAAHSGRFLGKFVPAQIMSTCGSCHSRELALFKSSKHFPDKKNVARLDCVQCHGAHTVGSPSRNFSYAYFCSGCHGLEYLPELNRPFQQMLEAADSQNDAINALVKSGTRPTDELISLRKQTRKMIANIVHATDYEGGREEISGILQINQQFKEVLASRKK